MATAEQIKSLIKSHLNNDSHQFYTVALQVAAHEAKKGHQDLAHNIRDLVNNQRQKVDNRILSFPKEFNELVDVRYPDTPKTALVIPKQLQNRIDRIIREFQQQNKLKSYGLSHRRKLLLVGPPGTGKTMTAQVLSNKLDIPLGVIQVDKLVTKYMGETSAKLRQIFNLVNQETAVYLFDEFDAIGGERSFDNDVGEMRRVLNSFLQFLEHDQSNSVIVAATNNPKLLDQALFRRFDDILHYEKPDRELSEKLIKHILGTYLPKSLSWNTVLSETEGLSHADIVGACTDVIKENILGDNYKATEQQLLSTIKERKLYYKIQE